MAQDNELLNIADSLNRLVKRGGQSEIQEPLELLEQAIKKIGKSWSGSWLGYHANVYYKGLNPRPPGARFDGLKGSYRSDTVGEWVEFDRDYVKTAIHEEAGNPDMEPLQNLCEEAAHAFEVQKLNVLSIIEAANSSDSFLKRLEKTLDELTILSSSKVLNALKPSGKILTSDMTAISQGLQAPPHISVRARIVTIRPWPNMGTKSPTRKFGFL